MERQIQYSEREKQVIELLMEGRSNKQIALALGVSLRTVEFHLSHIYAKLGVTSRTEAALKLSKTELRESTGRELRESTVLEMGETDDNVKTSISRRRSPMNKSSLIGIGILIATSAFCVGSIFDMAKERSDASATQEAKLNPTSLPATTFVVPTQT